MWFAIAVPLFLLAFLREWPLPTGWRLIDWHVHELLFAGLEGVLALHVAGAAPRTRGALMALFVIGRVAIATSAWIGPLVAALADLALPALLLAFAGRRHPRDWAQLTALAALFLADALFHLEAASGQLGLGFRLGLADALAILCVAVRRAAPQPAPSAAPLAAGLATCAALIALGRLGAWLLDVLPGWIGPPSLHRGLAGLAAIGWAVGRRAVAIGVWGGVPIAVVGGIAFAILLLGRAPAGRVGRAADALAGAALAWWIASPDGRAAGVLLIAAGAGQALCRLPPIALAGRLGQAAAPLGLAALGAASLWPRLVTPSTGLHALGAALAITAAAGLGGQGIALLGLLLAAAARIAAPFSPHYTGLLKIAALFWLIGWMWLARRRLGSVLMRT